MPNTGFALLTGGLAPRRRRDPAKEWPIVCWETSQER